MLCYKDNTTRKLRCIIYIFDYISKQNQIARALLCVNARFGFLLLNIGTTSNKQLWQPGTVLHAWSPQWHLSHSAGFFPGVDGPERCKEWKEQEKETKQERIQLNVQECPLKCLSSINLNLRETLVRVDATFISHAKRRRSEKEVYLCCT